MTMISWLTCGNFIESNAHIINAAHHRGRYTPALFHRCVGGVGASQKLHRMRDGGGGRLVQLDAFLLHWTGWLRRTSNAPTAVRNMGQRAAKAGLVVAFPSRLHGLVKRTKCIRRCGGRQWKERSPSRFTREGQRTASAHAKYYLQHDKLKGDFC